MSGIFDSLTVNQAYCAIAAPSLAISIGGFIAMTKVATVTTALACATLTLIAGIVLFSTALARCDCESNTDLKKYFHLVATHLKTSMMPLLVAIGRIVQQSLIYTLAFLGIAIIAGALGAKLGLSVEMVQIVIKSAAKYIGNIN